MLRLTKTTLRLHLCTPFFLLICGVCFLLGIVTQTELTVYASEETGVSFEPVPYYFSLILIAALTAFNISAEFAEGTVRSKLVMGYKKTQLFAAQLISALAQSIICFAFVTAGVFIMGYRYYFSRFSADLLVMSFGLILLSFVCMAVICTVISGLIHHRALSILLCGGACIGMIFMSSGLREKLVRPEYRIVSYSENDYVVDQRTEKSELYVSGVQRDIMKAGYYMTPPSSLLISEKLLNRFNEIYTAADLEKYREQFKEDIYQWDYDFSCESRIELWRYPLWSGGAVILLTVIGVLISRKRNIN